MGSAAVASSSDVEIAAMREKEVENLSLTTRPLSTLKLFVEATVQYLRRSVSYLLGHGGLFTLVTTLLVGFGVLLVTVDGPHGKHVEEVLEYLRYGIWWIALGVASSIGLAVGSRVPLTSILTQVQLEAILWGIGTALGELPPYFISRAAGSTVDGVEELDASSSDDSGFMATYLNRAKRRLSTHSQHLDFITILVLASVPNPLFDLAGIMCGQLGVPFWEFFLATLIGKAIIKTHIQTIFIIGVCNNQLLDWMENKLIRILSHVPGLASVLPGLTVRLHAMKEKYIDATPHVPSHIKVKKWDFSFASIWNGIVWLMLLNFFVKIVTATAQRQLKKKQDKEIAALTHSD